MGLTISEHEFDGILLFVLNGEIDIYTVPQFLRSVERTSQEAPGIAVDLREVSLVDSSGLGALLRLAQSDGRRRPVVLICEGPSIPRLLELTKLDDRFVVVDDIDEIGPALETVLSAGRTDDPGQTGADAVT